MICPYCGGEIPSKDFAMKTPEGNYFHFPCADKALDEWMRMKKLEAVAEAAKIMLGEIDARTNTRSLDMGGKHGITMQVKQGDTEYWKAVGIYNQALADLEGGHQ